ncbi:hypothetical protein GW17_00016146, partial [Ensete ventricosum]
VQEVLAEVTLDVLTHWSRCIYDGPGQASRDAEHANWEARADARATMSLLEVKDVLVEAAPISATAITPKKPTKGSMPPTEGSSHAHKQVKVTVGKHKSRRNEGSSRAYSKGKEPAEPGGSLHNPRRATGG